MAGLFYSFPLSSNWLQTEGNESKTDLKHGLQKLYKDKSAIVYLGDENCGKTLLLFQAAVAYASQDFNVTFISRCPLSKMPLPVHGTIRPEAAGQLKTLTFLYMSKVGDLMQHCSSLHTKPVLPDVLVVDDLDFYLNQFQTEDIVLVYSWSTQFEWAFKGLLKREKFNTFTDPSVDAGCALLCANLVDVKHFIQSKGGLGILMLGCRSAPTQEIHHVFPQYGLSMANITALESDKKSAVKSGKEYRLVLNRKCVSVTLTYSIEEIGLYLQTISLTSSDIPNT